MTYHHNHTMDKKYDVEENNNEKKMVYVIDLENINDNKNRYPKLYDDDVSQKTCFEKELAFLKWFFLILGILKVMFIFFVLIYFKVDNWKL